MVDLGANTGFGWADAFTATHDAAWLAWFPQCTCVPDPHAQHAGDAGSLRTLKAPRLILGLVLWANDAVRHSRNL